MEWSKTDARPAGVHAHRFRELFWIVSGHGSHQVNGAVRPLKSRMLILVHQDDRHTLVPLAGEALRFVNVAFPLAAWRYLAGRYWPREADLFEADDAGKEFRLDEFTWQELNLVSQELREGSRGRAAMERFLLNLHFLLRQRPAVAVDASLPPWLCEAMAAVRRPENLAAGLPAFLAVCRRSREHVARVTRALLHKSPTDLVNDARLAHAADQLAGTDRPILDLSLACGFGHLGHFYAQFARRYRMTPRVYRLQQHRLIRPA